MGQADFKKAVHYYKDGSSINEHKSKNNLGIIYANGLNNEKNIQYAIELFGEAIKLKEDSISLYNLSLIYFYQNDLDKCLDLIIKSKNNGLFIMNDFFPLVMFTRMLKCPSVKTIESELKTINIFCDTNFDLSLSNELFIFIREKLYDQEYLKYVYNLYKTQYIIYNIDGQYILISTFLNQSLKEKDKRQNISSSFYDGFVLCFHVSLQS